MRLCNAKIIAINKVTLKQHEPICAARHNLQQIMQHQHKRIQQHAKNQQQIKSHLHYTSCGAAPPFQPKMITHTPHLQCASCIRTVLISRGSATRQNQCRGAHKVVCVDAAAMERNR